jgi:gamma-glutamyltranspeptidase/glutathione hydrolase
MQFDPLYYPYPSRRNLTIAKNGMVATSQPLAAQAGLEILRRGGNAVDAAIATAACLTVVEPTSNGIGGDAFALVWFQDKLYGLNASGPAPRRLTNEHVTSKGYREMPKYGWLAVTVPGAPAAWAELSKRFGALSLKEVLQPAIRYAEEGYPVSPTLGRFWKAAADRYCNVLKGEEYQHWFDTFAPNGNAPAIGDMVRLPDHAKTLRTLAETDGEAFYRGELAEKIVRFAKATGGLMREDDLEGYQPEWVQPIQVSYRGYEVWELPPNGQGLVTLMALNILKGFEFREREHVETYHRQIEAMKLAFADGLEYITQEDKMPLRVQDLLAVRYADVRRALIQEHAIEPTAGRPDRGGTVYLATADAYGNMVSFIQSNYMGFGSGIVIPETGIALQNRGHSFSLNPTHANCLEPGKKPYHTIIPGFLTKDGQALGPFGVMGGFMQPQGHLQVVMNLVDFHLNPQAALDAPRWQWIEGKTVELEHGCPEQIALALARKGHDVRYAVDSGSFGRGQIILRDKNGVLYGGTESRTDGAIAAW